MFKVRGSDQSGGQQQYGWNRMSHDYKNHLAQMMRTTSVLTDVPQYPNVHNVFKKKGVASTTQTTTPPKASKKKVHIAEQEKTIISNSSGESGVVEDTGGESIDVEADADSFIQQKHKAFELCKWTTFKRAR